MTVAEPRVSEWRNQCLTHTLERASMERISSRIRADCWRPSPWLRHVVAIAVARVAGGALLVATVAALMAAPAGAAGSGGWYGGSPPTLGAGSVSILVAKDIGQSGGTLSAPVHHGWLGVTVAPGSVGQPVQCIVALDAGLHAGSRTDVLLALSFFVEHSGNPIGAGKVTYSFTGSGVSAGAHVEGITDGKSVMIASTVAGGTVTFVAPADHTFVIFRK